MWVAQEAGVGGVGGDLVVEEQAPVVAVRHGQFAIGKCQPVEYLVHYLLIVVHQGIGSPLFRSREFLLEEFQGQGCLAKLLHDDVLIGGVEVVVVLECEVVIEVFALVEVANRLLVVFGVYDGVVCGIVLLRIAVDGELPQALEPARSQRVVGEHAQCGSQDVGLPSVLFGLRVACIACGDAALQFVVALGLQQLVDVVLLSIAELVPLEECAIGHRHCPKRTFPDMVGIGDGTPVVAARANLQFVGFVGGVGEDKALHGHLLQVVPRHACRQRHLSPSIFDKERAYHREVGIGSHASFIVGHRVLASEAAAHLIDAVGPLAVLEVVLHVGGEVGKHLQQVSLHIGLTDEVGEHTTFRWAGF